MDAQVTVSCPRDRCHVRTVRALAWSLFDHVPSEAADDLVLALTEACANAVLHADGSRYAVRIDVRAARCTIEVVDGGAGFTDSDLHVAPTATHGRGLRIIRTLVDDVEFERDHEGMLVRLTKRWSGQAAGGDAHRSCRSSA